MSKQQQQQQPPALTAPATVTINLQGIDFNSMFLCFQHYDKTVSQSNIISSLEDRVRSGVRRRFTIITRQELLDCIRDGKLGDKEAQSAFQQTKTATDEVLNKALLQRLAMVWQEKPSIEKMAMDLTNSISGQEKTLPPAVAADPETVKRQMKEAVAAQQQQQQPATTAAPAPSKKEAASKKGKAAEVEKPSTPPVNTAEEPKKPKTKLRDKGPDKGFSIKVDAINDEPMDGPDCYCYLVDLFSASTLNFLFHSGFKVHAVTSINDGQFEGVPSVLKMLSAGEHPGWSGIYSKEIAISSNSSGVELFDNIAKECYTVVSRRKAYDAYYNKFLQFDVANCTQNVNQYKQYRSTLEEVELNQFTSVEKIVDAMLDEVAGPTKSVDKGDDSSQNPDFFQTLELYFDKTASNLCFYVNSSSAAETELPNGSRQTASVVFYGNYEKLKRAYNGEYVTDSSSQITRTILPVMIPTEMRQALRPNEIERTKRFLRKAKLHLLSKLEPKVLDRTLLQLEFERFLKLATGHVVSIDNYCWFEACQAAVLDQIIQRSKLTYPVIKYHAFKEEGLLLVAMFPAPECNNEIVAQINQDVKLPTKTPFNSFVGESAAHVAPGRYIYNCKSLQSHENYTAMFPADGAQIRSYRNPGSRVSVVHDSNEINLNGTGSTGSLRLALENSQIVIHAEKKLETNFWFGLSLISGVDVRVSEDGTIIMTLTAGNMKTRTFKELYPQNEDFRVIFPEGHVARYLLGGTVEVLFKSGQVSKFEKPKGWIHIDVEGNVFEIDPVSGDLSKMKQLSIAKEYYPFEKKGVAYREDFTTRTEFEQNETQVIQFPDGTKMEMNGKETAIYSAGFPTIRVPDTGLSQEINLDGGIKILRTDNPKGGAAFEIRVPGSAKFFVFSDGNAQYIPEGLPATGQGRYQFNFFQNTLSVTDIYGSEYTIDDQGVAKASPPLEVNQANPTPQIVMRLDELMQQIDHYNVQRQQPKLFVVTRTGSGLQLHRDQDLVLYFKRCAQNPNCKITEAPFSQDPKSLLITCTNQYQGYKPGDLFNHRVIPQKFFLNRKLVRHPPLQERIKQEVQGYIDKVSSFDQVSQAEAEAVAKNLEASSFTADMIREAKAENNPESIGAESKDKAVNSNDPSQFVHMANVGRVQPKPVKHNRPSFHKLKEMSESKKILPYFHTENGKKIAKAIVSGDQEKKVVTKPVKVADDDSSSDELADTPPSPTQVKLNVDGAKNVSDQTQSQLIDKPITIQTIEHIRQMNRPQDKPPSHVISTNLMGEPRKDKIKLPRVLHGGKPGVEPNEEFILVESPTKLHVKTVSTFHPPGGIPITSSFKIHPASVQFGKLKDGLQYITSLTMNNVGVESVRFKLHLSSDKSGIKVVYKPGPVAAGLSVKLDIVLSARAPDGQHEFHIKEEIKIVSEWEILHVPVSATILSTDKFEELSADPNFRLASHVRIVD